MKLAIIQSLFFYIIYYRIPSYTISCFAIEKIGEFALNN